MSIRHSAGSEGTATAPPSGRVGVVHVHSSYSADGRDSLEELREFGLERGLRFIALTDHAENFTPDIFRHFVAHCDRLSDEQLRLYPGLEFRFDGFTGLHLLALHLRGWIEPRTPAEFIASAPAHCELTVVAHPILTRHTLPAEVASGIDAVEVWNATYNTRYLPDVKAVRLYQRLHRERPELLAIAGLDQHDRGNDREVRVLVNDDAPGSHIGAIRRGAYVNLGRTMRLSPEVGWGRARTAAMQLVRWTFDRIERMQERAARTRQRRRRDTGG